MCDVFHCLTLFARRLYVRIFAIGWCSPLLLLRGLLLFSFLALKAMDPLGHALEQGCQRFHRLPLILRDVKIHGCSFFK